MPKIKSHKGAQARFKITGTGKIMRSKIGKSHLRIHKLARTKRAYHTMVPLNATFATRIKRALPYIAK